MKKLYFISAILIAGMLLVSSCDMINDVTNKDINPDETVAKEGNMWEGTATGYPGATATVMTNTKGIATINVNYNGQGYAVKAKVSKTKIEDYFYSGGDESKGFTLVDFDGKVGDKWDYTIGTVKVTREITYKSTTDDFYALGLLIKVVQVTESVPDGLTVNGQPVIAKQILWTFNHKFGWVGAELTKTDNTVVPVYITNTNAGSGK